MKKLTKNEMKNVMGGVEDGGGFWLVTCRFEPGWQGSFGHCTGDGTKEQCQEKADTWCADEDNHCVNCTAN